MVFLANGADEDECRRIINDGFGAEAPVTTFQDHYITTLVSGTASIVNQETRHHGDAARQTEQTIENIRRLIAPENFARHGLPAAGATPGQRDGEKLRSGK